MDKLWVDMGESEKQAYIDSKHEGVAYKLWTELSSEERDKVMNEIFRVYYECNLEVVGVKKDVIKEL